MKLVSCIKKNSLHIIVAYILSHINVNGAQYFRRTLLAAARPLKTQPLFTIPKRPMHLRSIFTEEGRPHHGSTPPKTMRPLTERFIHERSCVNSLKSAQDLINNDRTLSELLRDACQKEQEETAQGRYTFIHGRQWRWDFLADMYKQLYNITVIPKKQMSHDYTPLRFGFSENSTQRGDLLFVNPAFCVNTENWWGSNSLWLVLENYDWSEDYVDNFSVEDFFKTLKLPLAYEQYQNNIEKLEGHHKAANPGAYGSLLLICISDKDIKAVRPIAVGRSGETEPVFINEDLTTDIRAILRAYKNNHASIQNVDSLEFGLDLTSDYTLDPQKGLRVFRFGAVDKEKWRNYCIERDRLFAKIKKDLAKNKN